MTTPFSLYKNDEARAIVLQWWRSLEEDRATRAQLRRARGPGDVAFVPGYHRLVQNLQNKGHNLHREKLALIAGLLAHIKENDAKTPFSAQLAKPMQKGGPPRFSGLRFRRVLVVDSDIDELYSHLRRAVQTLRGRAHLLDLAAGAYHWSETVRKNWAYKYYETNPKAN